MKHINLTNWRGSITDWTKLNYIYGGLDDSYAVKGNLRIDKDNYNYVEYREGYNKFNFNENVVSVSTATTPHSISLSLDTTDKVIQAQATDTYSRAIIKLKEDMIIGEEYTFSFNLITSANIVRIALSSTGTHIDERDYGYLALVSSGNNKTLTFTATTNNLYLHLYLTTGNSSCDMTMSNIMLNIGDTALTYEPYFEGKKYVITENLGIVDLGSLSYSYYTGSQTPVFISPRKSDMKQESGGYCPLYDPLKDFWASPGNDMKIWVSTNNLNISNSNYNNGTTFKTAMDGVMFIYYLKDPVIEVVE